MIRLAIICFLISMIRSEEQCKSTINDVTDIRRLFHDSKRQMNESTQGQSTNAVIVLGNARAGKSTLINYLMNNNSLTGYKKNLMSSEIKLKKANENNPGPVADAGPVSVTSIPTRWTSTRSEFKNLDFWDTAGFEDNRGYMQDLNNSFHLHYLTKKVDSLKFIVVISFNDIISGNIDQVLSLLYTLDGYFNRTFEGFFPSISVIISKAPERFENRVKIDNTFLNNALTDKLVKPDLKMSNVSKDFIRQIIENNKRVGFFRLPKRVGKYTSNDDDNIIPAITDSEFIEKSSHQKIGFPFSKKTEFYLHVTNDNLLNMTYFIDLASELNNRSAEEMIYLNQLSNRRELLQKKAYFEKVRRSLNLSQLPNSDIRKKFDILKKSHNILDEFITKRDLMNKISLTEFIDSLIGTGKIIRIEILLDTVIKIQFDRTDILIALCLYGMQKIDKEELEKTIKDKERLQKEEFRKVQEKINQITPKSEESFWTWLFGIYNDAAASNPTGLIRG